MNRLLVTTIAALLVAGPALADPPGHDRRDDRHAHKPGPPAHAPAHGWHKDKHANHPNYRGHSGVVYSRDYGIRSGRCDRDAIGTAIGAVAGVAIGAQVAGPDDRAAGMIVGGALGALLGHQIGAALDDRDRACIGHALEVGVSGRPVTWRHAGHDYRFVPGRDGRDGCRYATLKVGGKPPRDVLACPSGQGRWTLKKL